MKILPCMCGQTSRRIQGIPTGDAGSWKTLESYNGGQHMPVESHNGIPGKNPY